MATIYSFPGKADTDKQTYRLSLYSDIEVEAVMTCVNVFSILDYKVTMDNLTQLDPRLVIECLKVGQTSWIFTDEFKQVFAQVIDNMQVV